MLFEKDGKLIIEWKAGGDGVDLEASGLSADILSALATVSGEEIRVFALPEKLDQNLAVFLNTVQEQARFGGPQPIRGGIIFMDDNMTVDILD